MSKEPEYTGPPEYESLHLPNARQQRQHLASIAGDLTRDELDAKAAEIGMDVSGAKTKAEAVEAVQDAARTVVVTPNLEG